MDVAILIPAGGSGKRMKAKKNKLLMSLSGKPIIIRTTYLFLEKNTKNHIIIAVPGTDYNLFYKCFKEFGLIDSIRIIEGGSDRQESVYKMLKTLNNPEIVIVHDGARPLFLNNCDESISMIRRKGYDGAVFGVPLKDTIKKVDKSQSVILTPERDDFWIAQTPQIFPFSVLIKAHEKARSENFKTTDDSSLVEHYGGKIKMIESSYENIKITTLDDITIARAILKTRGNNDGR